MLLYVRQFALLHILAARPILFILGSRVNENTCLASYSSGVGRMV